MTSVTLIGPDEENGGVGMYTTDLSEELDAENVRRLPIDLDPIGYFRECFCGITDDTNNIHIQYTYEIFGPKGAFTYALLPIMWILTRTMKKNIVLTIHEVWDEEDTSQIVAEVYATIMHLTLYLFTDTLIFLSQNALDTYRDNSLIGDGKLIPHGVHINETQDISSAKEVFGVDSDTFLVTQHGFVNPRKGFDKFVEIAEEMPDQDFLLAGGPRNESFQDFFEQIESDAPSNLRIIGVLDSEEFHAAFQASDLALLPYDSIYQSGILNWCAAYGVPVLASDIQYFQEVARFNGAPETFSSVSEATKKIRLLQENPERRQTLGHKMYQYAQKNSFENVAKMNREVYR